MSREHVHICDACGKREILQGDLFGRYVGMVAPLSFGPENEPPPLPSLPQVGGLTFGMQSWDLCEGCTETAMRALKLEPSKMCSCGMPHPDESHEHRNGMKLVGGALSPEELEELGLKP